MFCIIHEIEACSSCPFAPTSSEPPFHLITQVLHGRIHHRECYMWYTRLNRRAEPPYAQTASSRPFVRTLTYQNISHRSSYYPKLSHKSCYTMSTRMTVILKFSWAEDWQWLVPNAQALGLGKRWVRLSRNSRSTDQSMRVTRCSRFAAFTHADQVNGRG